MASPPEATPVPAARRLMIWLALAAPAIVLVAFLIVGAVKLSGSEPRSTLHLALAIIAGVLAALAWIMLRLGLKARAGKRSS
jgi:hypothetical protein